MYNWKEIARCETSTVTGAIIKRAILDLNINVSSEYKTDKKHSRKAVRKALRNHAINYLMSDLCRLHCDIIFIDYDIFIERVSILIEESKKELTLSYQ